MARMLKLPLHTSSEDERWAYVNAEQITSIRPPYAEDMPTEVRTSDGGVWHVDLDPDVLANATRNGPTDLTRETR